MNLYESVSRNLKESSALLGYLNGANDIKEILKNNDITSDSEIAQFMNTLDRQLINELSSEDEEAIKDNGGYFIKDLTISEPKYDTTDVVSSSFSEYVDYTVSCTAYWYIVNETKSIPLNYTFRIVYNNFS